MVAKGAADMDVRREWLVRDGRRLAVDLHGAPADLPVAVVAHGLNGAPDQPHMAAFVAACRAAGLSVVAPHFRDSDATVSDGSARGFTMAGAVAELAEVLDWTGGAGLGTPALVAGHSMGG